MRPDSPHNPREELEARLTALLLGELSAEEAAALRQAIGQDAELARLESQLKETIGLVREATASKEEKTVEPAAPPQLSAERREKLLASFKTTRLEIPKKPGRKIRLNREVLKLAAMVVALLLVGGVVVSYFTVSKRDQERDQVFAGEFAGEEQLRLGLDLKPATAPPSAKAKVVTVMRARNADPGELPAGSYYAGAVGVESASDAALERAKGSLVAAGTGWNQPEQVPARSVRPLPSPSESSAAPANKQLAQNAERFRTTIALPTPSEAQAAGATFESFGATPIPGGGKPVGRASARAEDFASSVTGGSDKLQVEELREESDSRWRSGLAGGPRGFGGGGGGFGGRRGPVAASEVKDAGRIGEIPRTGDPASIALLTGGSDPNRLGQKTEASVRQQEPPAFYWGAVGTALPSVGTMGGASSSFGNKESPANKPQQSPLPESKAGWFSDMDINGPAPAPGQTPVGRASPRANAPNEPAAAATANPVAAVDPATGLPAASTAAGNDSYRMGVRDTGIALTTDDLGGLRFFKQPPQEAQGQVAPTTGLPVAGGVVDSESETATALSREGAEVAREKNITAAGAVEDDAVFRKGGEMNRSIPTRPSRSAAIPAETPAPTQKPDAAKPTISPDDVDMLLKQPETKAYAVLIPPPPSPSPSVPAATPVPALEVKTKNVVPTQPLSVIDNLAPKNEQDTPIPLANVVITNAASANFSFGSTVNDGFAIDRDLQAAGTYINGTLITDPTHGTGDGKEWGIREKLDADGDSASRRIRLEGVTQFKSKRSAFLQVQDQTRIPQTAQAEPDLLADLTQRQSKKPEPAEVQDKLAKVDRGDADDDKDRFFRTGDGSQDQSGRYTGYTFNRKLLPRTAPTKSPPVVDEERKKESEAGLSQTFMVRRTNGSAGAVTVRYATNRAILGDATGKKQVESGDDFAVTMSRTDGTSAGKAAEYRIFAESLIPSEDSKRVSEESLSRKSRVEIALPPGGENVQGVEREPRLQLGPVVTSEIKFHPPPEEKPAYVHRLGKVGERAAESKEVADEGLRKLAADLATKDKDIARLKDELERREKELKPENVSGKVESLQKADAVPVQEFVDIVIPLKTAPAADIARMLQSSTATGDLAVLGQTKIIVDERTNSLLIFASRNDLNSISNAIRRLDAPVPQGEVDAAENAFSTFSLNVSDVSFKLAAASLEKGQMPDPATVRSEEFINAFDYRDPEPKGSAPIAFAWERARYPFAHNRDLLRFSVKTAASGRQPGRPLNLVLLLDNSGSMERADRVRVIRECIRVLAGQLQAQDVVSVVAFARTARLVVDGFSGSDAGNLPEVIGQLAPDGGTNLEEAMRVAYQTALKHFLPNGVNRVVLLTDGAANLGDVEPESLKKKVEAHRKQGVALDCFGIGWEGYNDDLLEVLSRNGDGRYGFVNTPEAAASEFAGQLAGALRVAASDVKVQVQFNPRRVTAWRQIGYAKHQLKKEQFRDNTVDAAEIGAAEQGNALYTVQVNPSGEGPIGMVRVRFKVPGTSDYREHEWAVPYSGAATPLEQCSAPMRLAATASAFSEWLLSSPFAGEVTPDRLLGYLNGVPESCAADPRPKKLEWMIRQARSLAGK